MLRFGQRPPQPLRVDRSDLIPLDLDGPGPHHYTDTRGEPSDSDSDEAGPSFNPPRKKQRAHAPLAHCTFVQGEADASDDSADDASDDEALMSQYD